jgi:hypothetical protein
VKAALKVIGFVAGFGAAVGVEFLILSGLGEATHRTIMPRGLGWVVIPVVAGIAGARFLSNLQPEHVARLLGNSQRQRYGIAAAASWVVLVVAYVIVAQPFGYYGMDHDDWMALFRWLLIPPVVGLFIYMAFGWASRPNSPVNRAPTQAPEAPQPPPAASPPSAATEAKRAATRPTATKMEATLGEPPAVSEEDAKRQYWRSELERRFPAKKVPEGQH